MPSQVVCLDVCTFDIDFVALSRTTLAVVSSDTDLTVMGNDGFLDVYSSAVDLEVIK